MARAGVKVTIRDLDKGYRRVRRMFDSYATKDSHVAVGLLGTEADEEREGGLTQAEIGAIHEYGSEDGSIPQRSWIGSTFDAQREKLLSMARELIGYVIDGKIALEKALGLLGLKLSTEIKKRVTTGPPIPPPNSPSVMERKAAKSGKTYANLEQTLGEKKYQKLQRRVFSGKTKDLGYEAFGVRTLVDTGRMIASVTWAVIIRGRK